MAKKTLPQSSQPDSTESTEKNPGAEGLKLSIPISKREFLKLRECAHATSEISRLMDQISVNFEYACPQSVKLVADAMLDVIEAVEDRHEPGSLFDE